MHTHHDARRSTPRVGPLVAAFLAAGAVTLAGCEDAEDVIELTHRETHDEKEAVSVVTPGELQDIPPATQEGIGGEVCMQARLCCEEVVSTMALHSEAVSARPPDGCAQVVPPGSDAPENACEDAMRQWRNALELANVEVPPHCRG